MQLKQDGVRDWGFKGFQHEGAGGKTQWREKTDTALVKTKRHPSEELNLMGSVSQK